MAPEANSEAAPTPTHLGQDQRLKFSTLAQESGMMMSTAAAIWMRGKGGGSKGRREGGGVVGNTQGWALDPPQ